MRKKICIIVAFFITNLFAMSANEAFDLAQDYEASGDTEKAMQWYKKAALMQMDKSAEPKKDSKKLLRYGKNSIESYDDKETDSAAKKIIYSAFDIKAHKSNYLLPFTHDGVKHDNRKQSETKFQLSFKKSLAHNLLGLNEKLYLGYTQTSWWQTSASSAPFRETNYEPEIFFDIPYEYDKIPLKRYKIGLLHQSNGRAGEFSRSWNRIYVSGLLHYYGLFIEPRLWHRIPESSSKDDNPDIDEYLGYGDIRFSYPYKEHLFSIKIQNNFRLEGKNRGAVELDWTFPIWDMDDVYGYLQYFNGYGESLIDYNKRNERIGVGFAITR